MIKSVIRSYVEIHTADIKYPEEWDIKAITDHFETLFLKPDELDYTEKEIENLTVDILCNDLCESAFAFYDAKEEEVGSEVMREFERVMLLRSVDKNWIEHIENMEQLKQGIRLRAFANESPIIAFKRESSDMYDEMNETIRRETVELIFRVQIKREQEVKREQVAKPTDASHGDGSDNASRTVVKAAKIGRNDPCPCGSGKKYKQCCGKE